LSNELGILQVQVKQIKRENEKLKKLKFETEEELRKQILYSGN